MRATKPQVVRPVYRRAPAAATTIKMLPTGSTLLDLQNGGGWGLGRMVNIVGDTSSGKTLLAIEACANFARLYGVDAIRYCETEAAFDESYAASLGLPEGIQRSDNVRTVEDFHDDLSDFIKSLDSPGGLYCLDSVDALSSEAEAKREIFDKQTYQTEKAKVLHELFRRRVVDIEAANVCLIMISQTKDNIGNMFAPKTRSGGRALDFFASQTIWLHEIKKDKHMVSGVERVTGIYVRSQNKKNKLGEPFRVADILVTFGYGVDDEISNIAWLKSNCPANGPTLVLSVPLDKYEAAVRRARDKGDMALLTQYSSELRAATRVRWAEIEEALRPKIRKYQVPQ